MTAHHFSRGTLAAMMASVFGQTENLRSDGQFIDQGFKTNHYRKMRIREVGEACFDMMREADRIITEYEAAISQEQTQ